MNDQAAGRRLKTFVEARMAERGMHYVTELVERSGVSRDTFQQWWKGRSPSRSTGMLAGKVLGVTYADLIAARDGRKEDTDPLVTAINGLTAALVALAQREGAPADPHAARMLELAARAIDPARNAEVPASQPSAGGKPARLG